ncbi:hypothetical protein [uncultured Algibacter sp.]|uniref:hypothetical protein n=1 Tax=uncultured Algibacter sp. TaxID=298659 RepID=UPI003217E56C
MASAINYILPKENLSIWNSYLTQKEMGLKKKSSLLLTEFINNIKVLDYKLIRDFAYCLTDKHRLEDLKIDFRLFENVIYPILVSEINANNITANRRLAQFEQFLLGSNPLFIKLKEQLNYDNVYFESADFYEREIEINNADQIAISGFLNRLASGLNYATHELPEYGLVWEIEYFEEELKRFKNILETYSEKEIWLNRIKHWDFVLKTWTNYLTKQNAYKNYTEYLNRTKLQFVE